MLRRLQNACAPCRQDRDDFERDLVDRPVPWRDQPADADGLMKLNVSVGQSGSLFKAFQRVDEPLQMPDGRIRLRVARHGDGGAHFHPHCLGEVFETRFRHGLQAAQQREPFGFAGQGKCLEGFIRRSHCAVRVLGIAKSDRAYLFLGRRVQHWHRGGRNRIDPFAADVEFSQVFHFKSPDQRTCAIAVSVRFFISATVAERGVGAGGAVLNRLLGDPQGAIGRHADLRQ